MLWMPQFEHNTYAQYLSGTGGDSLHILVAHVQNSSTWVHHLECHRDLYRDLYTTTFQIKKIRYRGFCREFNRGFYDNMIKTFFYGHLLKMGPARSGMLPYHSQTLLGHFLKKKNMFHHKC